MGEDDVNVIAINIFSKQHMATENHVRNIISNLGMSFTTSGQSHHQMNPGPPSGNPYHQHQSTLSQTHYPQSNTSMGLNHITVTKTIEAHASLVLNLPSVLAQHDNSSLGPIIQGLEDDLTSMSFDEAQSTRSSKKRK